MERYIEVARREARAQLERSEIRLRQLEAELERIRALVSNGAASQVALDTIQADLRMAQAEVDAQSARREALEIEAASLEQGVAIDGSVDGGLYARQRMDEVMLQLAELTALRETERGRLAGLEQQADTIATDFARRTSFQPLVAEAAVVWRAAPAVGSSVAAGDTLMELLDCQHRFLEVSLPGTLFERIRPGDRADVLFKGASDRVQAEVAAVGGAGARFDHSHLASDRPEIRADDIQVLVRLSPADASDPEVAASFCDVGRTAEVRFSRDRLAVLDLMASAADALGGWTWELVPLWTETTALQTEQLDPG